MLSRMASIGLRQACEATGVRRVYLPHLVIALSSQSVRLSCSRKTIIFKESSVKSSAVSCFRDDGWGVERKQSTSGRCCDSCLRARGKPNCRRLGSGDSVRKKDCFAFSGGNRFVRRLLTASSVIVVMPACMLTLPNPSSRNEWPAHCEGGIHYVWPRNWGAELVLVIVFAIAAHILQKQTKAAKQYH